MCIRDRGNSYQGLCSLIHAKTKGRDGVYFTYTEEAPIAFNPFYVEDGVYLSLIHILAKKPKIEVDESLVKQVIAGQLPITTKVTRVIPEQIPSRCV